MVNDDVVAVGALVEYWTGYGYQRSKISRVTAARVTLESGKFFTRRKHGRPWDFDVVPQDRLEFEVEAKHAAWLKAKPSGGRVVTKYDRRMGISVEVYTAPTHIDDICAELQAIKTWAAAEPQEPSRR